MLAGSHRNAWPDETGTGGRTNRNTQLGVWAMFSLLTQRQRFWLESQAGLPNLLRISVKSADKAT